jgi:hypothetical protein
MDEIVKQAMAKWPNVPHCYGWLALDARGHWRMRDERAQHFNLPGDKLSNPALVGFINRNYARDERGCWYFQNGPQRVYLELEATPYIVRTDPAQGWLLQTGEAFGAIDEAGLTEAGELVLRSGERVAQLDDRDGAQALSLLEMDGKPMADEALLAWLEADAPQSVDAAPAGQPVLRDGAHLIPVQRLQREQLPALYSFVRSPFSLHGEVARANGSGGV